MHRKIELEKWPRRKQFEYYRDFDDPFFNLTANVDVSQLYSYCKSNGCSIFLSQLHAAMLIINRLDAFKTRIKGEDIVVYDRVDLGSTVLHPDKTFSFCYFDFVEDLKQFNRQGKQRLDAHLEQPDFSTRDDELNLIHFSVIPWVSFTAFKHARNIGSNDTIPKLVFGKIFDVNGKKLMPVSVEVNHAMMDGYDVGQFFESFQMHLNSF